MSLSCMSCGRVLKRHRGKRHHCASIACRWYYRRAMKLIKAGRFYCNKDH